MALSPQKFREIVLQMLYSIDIGDSEEDNLIELMMHELAASKKSCKEAFSRASKVLSCRDALDALIGTSATSYEFDRIHTVERNVLRLALYELLLSEEIPAKVAIAEAIRLTKKFSTPEAVSFVNAILDLIYQQKIVGKDEQSVPQQ